MILSAGPAHVRVDPADGGRLTSLTIDGVELLGGDTPPPGAPAGWFTGCFPMAPFAGRLDRARFTFAGRTYELPANSGPHAQHGTVFDRQWTVDEAAGTRMRMSVDLAEPWPFPGTVEQTVALESHALTVTLTVRSHDGPMPASIGFHPWFRRDLGRGPAEIDVAPRLRYQPDGTGIVREAGPDLGQRPWDDVFTGLAAAPQLRWPGGPTLTFESEAPVWVVYERPRASLCIEPLSAPPNRLGASGGDIVRPGEPLSLTLRIRWDRP